MSSHLTQHTQHTHASHRREHAHTLFLRAQNHSFTADLVKRTGRSGLHRRSRPVLPAYPPKLFSPARPPRPTQPGASSDVWRQMEGPTPAGPGPSMTAATIEVIDLCDDTPVVAHSPEAEDAALARRLQAEEYGEQPPHWAPSEEYGKQQPPSGGGTSTRRSTGGSTSGPAKSKAPPRARSTGGSTGETGTSKAPKAPPKPPYPPATSVYTKSLDAALDAALSAVAADGAPLFTDAERQLLQAHRARSGARARVSTLLEYTPTVQVTNS